MTCAYSYSPTQLRACACVRADDGSRDRRRSALLGDSDDGSSADSVPCRRSRPAVSEAVRGCLQRQCRLRSRRLWTTTVCMQRARSYRCPVWRMSMRGRTSRTAMRVLTASDRLQAGTTVRHLAASDRARSMRRQRSTAVRERINGLFTRNGRHRAAAGDRL